MNCPHHIALTCLDRAKTEAFYTHFFGFRRARVFNAGKPNEFIMLRAGDFCVELFPPSVEGPERQFPGPVGFQHLAFQVADIEAKVRELTAAGVNMGNIIDCSDTVPGLRICFFKDPDGNTLELMQGWFDEPSEQA